MKSPRRSSALIETPDLSVSYPMKSLLGVPEPHRQYAITNLRKTSQMSKVYEKSSHIGLERHYLGEVPATVIGEDEVLDGGFGADAVDERFTAFWWAILF